MSLRQHIAALSLGKATPSLVFTAISQVATLTVLPLLARSYPSEQFGYLAIANSASTITATALTLRCEFLLPMEKSLQRVAELSSLLIVLSILPACALPIFLIAKTLLSIAATGVLSAQFVTLVALMAASGSLFIVMRALAARMEIFSLAAALLVVRSIVAPSLSIGLIILFGGELGKLGAGLILGVVAADLVYAAILLIAILRRHLPPLGISQALQGFRVVRERRRYFGSLFIGQFASILAWQIVPLVTSWAYSVSDAGHYSVVWRVAVAPAMLVGTSLVAIYARTTSAAYHERRPIYRSVRNILVFFGLGSACVFLPCAAFADTLIDTFLGSDWHAAKAAVGPIALVAWAYLVSTTISFLPILLDRITFLLGWNITRVITLAGAATVSTLFEFSFESFLWICLGLDAAMFLVMSLYSLRCAWLADHRASFHA